MRLANKTALITGGNSGIGLATAKLFIAEGAKVVITGRNKETLAAAAKELGPNALAVVADATDVAALEAAVKQGAEKFGKYDVLFANAGIPGQTPVGGTTLAAFENVIRTNLTGVFFTVQAVAPYLNDGASIILNGSVISVLGNPGYSAYAASKAGVISLVQTTAYSLTGTGVRINAVCPGLIETGMTKPVFDRAKERGTQDKIGQLNPLKRPGQPHELAAMGLFLASDEASYVNGQAIPVDGGLTASMPYTGKPI